MWRRSNRNTGWKKSFLGVLVSASMLFQMPAAVMAESIAVENAAAVSSAAESALDAEEAVVHTNHGDLRGSYEDGMYQFLGVEYATAKERFVLAEELEDWEGIKDATEYGPMSPQSAMLGMGAGSYEGTSNNSQNMNIWTPGIRDGKKRAVMVWLHGGGFSSGTANGDDYNGAALSSYGDVVVVGVNHRLGLSGFLDLSDYGEKYQYSGNAGLDDIVKALEWIQNNIEEFGGNPENVTVFGQSGGGAKVLALMTTPKAKGLFSKGIVQSGATETMGVTFSGSDAGKAATKRILEKLNITEENIEDLQTMDLAEIESASTEALQETAEEYKIPAPLTAGYAMEWGPIVDGDYLPSNPVTEDSFAESGKDIPLLIGSNLNEWTTFMGGNSDVSDEVKTAFETAYPEKAERSAGYVDTLIRLPLLKIMSHKADQAGANVYAYVFTKDDGMGGAYHGAEIPYVFHHVDGTLGDQMTQVWVNFAKNGAPSAEGIPEWEAYTRENGATMLLDDTSTLVYGHDKELMKALAPDYEY
ncbi:MAG: carboxylesterase family protein [Lachnospiraceae bacterium]|nr:carboxylesterase family protein [Lachnospiraceae bacterium]